MRPIEQFPPDVFHAVLTVMLEALFRLIRVALPHMYAQGWGRIVDITGLARPPVRQVIPCPGRGGPADFSAPRRS